VSATIQRRFDHGCAVLSVTGDLDVVGAPELRQAVLREVAEQSRNLVIDLSGLDFIDSFGLGVVVGALKRVRQRGGELAIICPVPRIRRVFELCDLDRVFVLHPSFEQANRAIQ